MAIVDPAFALDLWTQSNDEVPGHAPTALLTFGVESLGCTSIELDQNDFEGGAIFEWYVDDGGFTRKFNRLEDWFMYLSAALDADDLYEHRNAGLGRAILVPTDKGIAEYDALVAPGHPSYGDQTYIERDIIEWPTHWRILAGVTDDSTRLRGATHSIAELLSTDPASQVAATVRATVVSLADFGKGTNVRVDDGTGLLVINCPVQMTAVGPVISQTFEFDVVVPEGERVVAVDPKTLNDDLRTQMAAEYSQPIGAVAFAIRRV